MSLDELSLERIRRHPHGEFTISAIYRVTPDDKVQWIVRVSGPDKPYADAFGDAVINAIEKLGDEERKKASLLNRLLTWAGLKWKTT